MNIVKKIFFGKKAFQPLWRRLFDLSLEGLNIGTGGRSLKDSGELFAIQYALKGESNPVVFDIGAQGGDYSQEVLNVTGGKARIHAFEPRREDYEILENMMGKRISVVNTALGEVPGTATLYYQPDMHGMSTLQKRDSRFTQSETVKVDTVDHYCEAHGIKEITLLKIDTEGHELPCLRGALRTLPHVKYVQFEMSIGSRDIRAYFRDIFEILKDYTVYRILRDGLVEIKDPEKMPEMLFTTNYLAIRKTL